MQGLAATSNKICIYEPFAAVATAFQLRDHLWGRRVILTVDNGAARFALKKGVAKNEIALMLAYSLRPITAQYVVAIMTERAPTQKNPADLPPRRREPSFTTVPSRDLASIDQLLSMRDSTWMLFQQTD